MTQISQIAALADEIQSSGQYRDRTKAIREAARRRGVKVSPSAEDTSGDGAGEQDSPLARACRRLIDQADTTEPATSAASPLEGSTPLARACRRLIDQERATEQPGGASVASPLQRACERLAAR